jgi:hypothetical protein
VNDGKGMKLGTVGCGPFSKSNGSFTGRALKKSLFEIETEGRRDDNSGYTKARDFGACKQASN